MTPIVRVAITYLAYFGAIGAAWPYLPIYYQSLGLGLEAIGALAALGAAVQLLTAPAWGALADAFPRTRLTLPAAALVAVAGALLLVGARDLAWVVVGATVLAAGLAGIGPVLDARAIETLGPERIRYGQLRALGSLSFVVSALAVGLLIDRTAIGALFAVYVPTLVLTAIVSATLVRQPTTRHVGLARGAIGFVVAPGMRLFLFGTFLVWVSVVAVSAFYSIRMTDLGAPAQVVGLAWAIGAAVEVPVMWSYPRIAGRFGSTRPLVVGAALFGVRAAISAVAPSPLLLLAAAPIEGLAFGLFYVGGVTFVAQRAPMGMANTAQGVFTAVSGSATIVGSLVGGAIAMAVTIQGLFALCAALAAGATGVVAVSVRTGVMPIAVVSHSDGGSAFSARRPGSGPRRGARPPGP